MSFLMSNKIPAYAGMTAFLTFRLLLGFCKGFSLKTNLSFQAAFKRITN